MPASLATRITAMPSSRDKRSYVRHEPSDMIDTSIPDPPSGRCVNATAIVAQRETRRDPRPEPSLTTGSGRLARRCVAYDRTRDSRSR